MRKTKKLLRFCPCYIDQQHHTIRFGELVTYQPENTVISEESAHVSDELNQRIRDMAAASRRSPRERNTPLRRTIMFFCNLLRLLLLIPLIILLSLPNPQVSMILYAVSQGLRVLFNATVFLRYAASNHLSFLLSHALSFLTDICMLSYLCMLHPYLKLLLIVVISVGVINFLSNTLLMA